MIDRSLQNEILIKFKNVYPKIYSGKLRDFVRADTKDHFAFNLAYLEELGLIQSAYVGVRVAMLTSSYRSPPEHETPVQGKITAAGIDFMEDDGGLTAILGVVTIKFHQETLSELETMIQLDNTLPPEEKVTLLQKLRSLPEEGAKTLVQELVKAGLQKAPDGWNTAIHYLNSIPWGQTPAG